MTIGIAAYSAPDNLIVVASDMMISTGNMSADVTGIKSRAIARHWLALFAGNDISCVVPILKEVNEILRPIPDTLENVGKAFVDALQTQLRLKNENEILRPLGYTLERFQEVGLHQLGSEQFSRLLFRIESQTLDVEFLVAGFDADVAQIFTVRPPGTISNYTPLGFWAIGSGQTNALGSLFNSGAVVFADTASTMYRVCEAKFNSESAIGIGKKTVLTLLRKDMSRWSAPFMFIDALRPLWEKTRVLTVPAEAHAKTEELWATAKKQWEQENDENKSLTPD
jgi:20S proteasome alpha/beta subunit